MTWSLGRTISSSSFYSFVSVYGVNHSSIDSRDCFLELGCGEGLKNWRELIWQEIGMEIFLVNWSIFNRNYKKCDRSCMVFFKKNPVKFYVCKDSHVTDIHSTPTFLPLQLIIQFLSTLTTFALSLSSCRYKNLCQQKSKSGPPCSKSWRCPKMDFFFMSK